MLKFIKNTQNLANGHLKLTEYYPFEGILRERLFEGNILLAETYFAICTFKGSLKPNTDYLSLICVSFA